MLLIIKALHFIDVIISNLLADNHYFPLLFFTINHSKAPNFAYALAVRKFRDARSTGTFGQGERFELSSLQHMINAAGSM